jgi:hypothetical protein
MILCRSLGHIAASTFKETLNFQRLCAIRLIDYTTGALSLYIPFTIHLFTVRHKYDPLVMPPLPRNAVLGFATDVRRCVCCARRHFFSEQRCCSNALKPNRLCLIATNVLAG